LSYTRKKKILAKRVKRIEGTYAVPLDVVLATTASNMTGGTISLKKALTLLHEVPKEELESSKISELPEQMRQVIEKLDGMQKDYRGFLGQQGRAMGMLSPKIIREYYEAEKYTVREADDYVDKEFKIDLIAEKDDEIRVIQVKKGAVSSQEIREICEKAPNYFEQKISHQKVKIVDIVADRFPVDYLQIRDEIGERQKEIALNYIHFYQVIQRLPKYRTLF